MPSSPIDREVAALLRDLSLEGHERIAVWGAGECLRSLAATFFESAIEVAFLIDDDPDLVGKRLLGWEVVSSETAISRSDFDAVLVSSRHAPHIKKIAVNEGRFADVGKGLFFLNPSDVPTEAVQTNESSILLVTVPKSGTWLTMRLLSNLGFSAYHAQTSIAAALREERIDPKLVASLIPPGKVLTLHDPRVIPEVIPQNMKVVFLYRDPRDIVVARSHFWKHPENERRRVSFADYDIDEVMLRFIKGELPPFSGIYELMDGYYPLLSRSDLFALRFEDLIAATTGDSRGKRRLIELGKYLEIDERYIDSAIDALEVRPSPGRSHIVEEWRREFTANHVSAFVNHAQTALEEFGYEGDTSWAEDYLAVNSQMATGPKSLPQSSE